MGSHGAAKIPGQQDRTKDGGARNCYTSPRVGSRSRGGSWWFNRDAPRLPIRALALQLGRGGRIKRGTIVHQANLALTLAHHLEEALGQLDCLLLRLGLG